MATTLTAADLTVTITEAITLNGVDQGASNTMTIADINETYKRIQEILHTGGAQIILTFCAAPNQVLADVRYVRITNLDNANYLIFQILTSASNNRMAFKLEAGQSFILQGDGVRAIDSAAPCTGYEAFQTIAGIRAAADTAVVDTEIVVAFKPA